ncbi:MAG TPA: cytochrome c3 family protein [Gammaproteobacteria bacterium]
MVRTQGQARLAAGCRTAVLLSALGGLALLGGTQPAGAGIALTKHNLSGSLEGPATAVCVFCHTPSGDPTAATQPLWNGGQVDDSTTYSMFDDLGRLDPNRDGVVGTVSVACMSCHDDTQAQGITNLQYDHPIGVVYRGAEVGGIDVASLPSTSTNADGTIVYEAGTSTAPQRFARSPQIIDATFRRATSSVIDGQVTYWVETGSEGRQRTDIKLYARHFGDGVAVPFIECASCHDPHSETETFLRVDNRAGSTLCLGCHDI